MIDLLEQLAELHLQPHSTQRELALLSVIKQMIILERSRYEASSLPEPNALTNLTKGPLVAP